MHIINTDIGIQSKELSAGFFVVRCMYIVALILIRDRDPVRYSSKVYSRCKVHVIHCHKAVIDEMLEGICLTFHIQFQT